MVRIVQRIGSQAVAVERRDDDDAVRVMSGQTKVQPAISTAESGE
jgi:hypothetical protein